MQKVWPGEIKAISFDNKEFFCINNVDDKFQMHYEGVKLNTVNYLLNQQGYGLISYDEKSWPEKLLCNVLASKISPGLQIWWNIDFPSVVIKVIYMLK